MQNPWQLLWHPTHFQVAILLAGIAFYFFSHLLGEIAATLKQIDTRLSTYFPAELAPELLIDQGAAALQQDDEAGRAAHLAEKLRILGLPPDYLGVDDDADSL